MSIDPVTNSPLTPPTQAGGPARPDPRQAFADALTDAQRPAPAPDEPTTEALAAVQVAGQVYARLRALDRELRFEHTPHGVRIEVYDGNGRFVQSVPATEVLKFSAGEQGWLA